MKTITLTTIFLLLGFFLQGQNQGRIIYEETIKIEVEGLDPSMKDMIPFSQSTKKELVFKDHQSVYQNVKGEEVEDLDLTSEDGSFQIKIKTDETENILFKDFTARSLVHQKGMMGKSFVVTDSLPQYSWKIKEDKIKYLGYECQKAVIETEDQFIVAWFTSEIPVQLGPGGYHGLPGCILMLSVDEGKRSSKALSVSLEPINAQLKAPSKGKKVSEEKYQAIQAEKIKEMEESFGTRRVKIRN